MQALFGYLSHGNCELAVDYTVIDGPNEVRMRSAKQNKGLHSKTCISQSDMAQAVTQDTRFSAALAAIEHRIKAYLCMHKDKRYAMRT